VKRPPRKSARVLAYLVGLMLLLSACPAHASLNFGPIAYVECGGIMIHTEGYSVPTVADWNGDGLFDLIIGEGGGGFKGRVRIYLNEGSAEAPLFNGFTRAQTPEGDLTLLTTS